MSAKDHKEIHEVMKRLMDDDDYQYDGGSRQHSSNKNGSPSNHGKDNNNTHRKAAPMKNKVLLNEDQEK